MKKILSLGLVLALIAGTLSGCSGGGASGGKSTASGMGRYVEKEFQNPGADSKESDEENANIMSMAFLEDGTLRALVNSYTDNSMKMYDSKDSGATWEVNDTYDFTPYTQMETASEDTAPSSWKSINSASVGPDGSVAFILNESTYSENVSDSTYAYYYMASDGTARELPTEFPNVLKTEHYEYTEADAVKDDKVAGETSADDDGVTVTDGSDSMNEYNSNGINSFKMGMNGNLFVLDYNGTVYEVNVEDGAILHTFNGAEYANDYVVMKDKVLIYSYDTVSAYNLSDGSDAGEYPELADKLNNSRTASTMCTNTAGDTLYYAIADGIYKYNLSNNTAEQIVDGSLTSLCMMESSFSNLIAKPEDGFMISYQDYSANSNRSLVLDYTYDANMPTVPDNEITVYSLTENYALRQAAALYQKANPDTHVVVEVGMSGSDGATVSDAIRSLNTQIMGGEGPDVIFMDGIPVDSYVEKGLLEDVSDVINPMIEKGQLFENITKTYQTDKGIYAVPTRFTVPVIIGEQSVLDGITSTEDLVQASSDYAADENNSGKAFTRTYSKLNLMGSLISVNAPGWFNEDGSLNADTLKAFINNVDTLYSNVEATMSDTDKEALGSFESYMQSADFSDSGMSYSDFASSDSSYDTMYLAANMASVLFGSLSRGDSLEYIYSAQKVKEGLTYKALNGVVTDVYSATDIIGISSKSDNKDTAKNFLTYMLTDNAVASVASYMSNGFSVNITAFDKSLTNPNKDDEWYVEGEALGGIGTTDENGNEVNLELYWPTDEQTAEFKALVQTLKTPAYNDDTILDTIIASTMDHFYGDKSVDQVVEEISQKINIYLSE